MNLIIQRATNNNRHIAEAKRAAGMEGAKDKNSVYAGRKKAYELFYMMFVHWRIMSTG